MLRIATNIAAAPESLPCALSIPCVPFVASVTRVALLCLWLCFFVIKLSAIEGVDSTTKGDWHSAKVEKPWSYEGQNIYGTAGYHFYNVTPLKGDNKQALRPTQENLCSSLPPYIRSIETFEGSYTSNSYGYLPIDAPWKGEDVKLESGILVKKPPKPGLETNLVRIFVGEIPEIYGFRIGILVCNADRPEISPAKITISQENGNWQRSVTGLPPNNAGIWIFFNVPAEHANQTLLITVRPNGRAPAAISGLVFDDLTVAPPEQPLNVVSNAAVTRNGSATWNADIKSASIEAPVDNWEQRLAQKTSNCYRDNEQRIADIKAKLTQLPQPYTGEPTGTGGFLSNWTGSSKNSVKLDFRWNEEVTIDAVALLPLRLFLADAHGLTNNAYWPGKITLKTYEDNSATVVKTISSGSSQLEESLPEIVSFDPVTTRHLKIILSDLPRKVGGYQYAAGLAEVCIFSGTENIAPRAITSANNSREGFRVFSKNYLTDGQTPLGLPELGPRISGSLGLSIRMTQVTPKRPVAIEIDFDELTKVDSVRIDPAVIYKPGQAFPIRFTVDLIDENNNMLHSDITYRDTPLRNLGLNPYTSYFPETLVKRVRVRIYEISKPTSKSRPWIQISEISPMLKGQQIRKPAQIYTSAIPRRSGTIEIRDPSGRRLYWQTDFVYDGQTQAGRAIPLRQWLEGLYQRKLLLIELRDLKATQKNILTKIRRDSLWGACLFIAIVVVTALLLVIRSRVKSRRELQMARERIASDLHDDVGSNLGTITLHTEFLLDQIESDQQREHLKAITKLTKESVYGLREVLHTSAPRIGRAQNIIDYMEELSLLVLPDIKVKFDLNPSLNHLLESPQLRKGIILYYKEAITNIQSHAKCQHVFVSMHKHGKQLELNIQDDGVGISPEQLNNTSTLRTLKLRAKEMGADLKIITRKGEGTRLELKFPLK
jgi:signal transduction histidine kinase